MSKAPTKPRSPAQIAAAKAKAKYEAAYAEGHAAGYAEGYEDGGDAENAAALEYGTVHWRALV